MRKPERLVLTLWRVLLVLITLIPALFTSLIFHIGGLVWTVFTVVWVLAFLFFYLFYLPVRYRKMQYLILPDQVEFHSGVFWCRERHMPLDSIQFVGTVVSPLDAAFGLASLRITAAGARILLPGLKRSDATLLVQMLPSKPATNQ